MTVKIGNKEVQLTDYLSSNQIKKVLYEAYEQGYQDGGEDMEKAKQILIDGLLKQIEQIKADAIDEFAKYIDKHSHITKDGCEVALDDDITILAEQLKEQKND